MDIRVSSQIRDNWLELGIVNTGKFEPDNSRVGTGIKNVRERLENAYPGNHEFEILQREDRVHIIIKISLNDEHV